MGFTDKSQRYRFDEYQSWDDEQRWELIDGEPFLMSPSPSSRHQAIVADLCAALTQQSRSTSCRTFVAPMDVKLSDHNVVQPDLFLVCDSRQIRPRYIEGAPDLVVEVLSPSTYRHDRLRKLQLYARFGVPEYWLIQPNPATIEVLVLDGTHYRVNGVFTDGDTLKSPSFPDFDLKLSDVFTLPVPPDEWIDEVREGIPPYGAEAAP